MACAEIIRTMRWLLTKSDVRLRPVSEGVSMGITVRVLPTLTNREIRVLRDPRPRAAGRDQARRVPGLAYEARGSRDRARRGAARSGGALRCARPSRSARPRTARSPPEGEMAMMQIPG